jgi:hypothetical protein
VLAFENISQKEGSVPSPLVAFARTPTAGEARHLRDESKDKSGGLFVVFNFIGR